MSRSHGRIMTAIWTDPDFLALGIGPQRLYMFFLSQPELSHTGLLPLRRNRWVNKAKSYRPSELQADLEELVRTRFVLADDATGELLIRTLVRNDNVWKQPKVMRKMCEEARQMESPVLRRAFLAELDKLSPEGLPDYSREVLVAVRKELHNVLGTPAGGYMEGYRVPYREGYPEGYDGPGPSEPAATLGDNGQTGTLTASPQVDTLSGTLPDTPAEGYGEGYLTRDRAQPPSPKSYNLPPSAGEIALRAPLAAETAQTLVAEWIDNCAKKPPRNVVGQVAKHTGQMLNEGIDYQDVRLGLGAWAAKGAHPSTLPSFVNEAMNARPNGGRSTTDDRVRQGMELAERFRRQEAGE